MCSHMFAENELTLNRAACLVDELLSTGYDAVGVSFKHSPRFRREDLVDGRPVQQRLLVLEKADYVVDESARVVWRRVIKATDSIFEQEASDRCQQLQNQDGESRTIVAVVSCCCCRWWCW